jgi:hypothetical protein
MGNLETNRPQLENLRKLSEWLDSKYQTPFGIKIGWDGILNLIPFVGEFSTTLISGYIIIQAAILGAPVPIILRMAINVFLDGVIGAIPLLGWIGDFVWKSNLKNVRLLDRYMNHPDPTARRSKALVITLAIVFLVTSLAIGFALAYFAWQLTSALFRLAFP